MKRILLLILTALIISAASAKVDLVTLPSRDTTQLTIYNSADLTLVRDARQLTLKEGQNDLQFSWAGTLIDPTSLEMLPKANADKIDIAQLVFPPRVRDLGLWNIDSQISCKVPVEITYLTSGLSWRAFYMGTLSNDEKTMRLQGYVRVTNNSGEDYENAQTRLIVGTVHILDEIAALAQRQYPYERPGMMPPQAEGMWRRELGSITKTGAAMDAVSELAYKPKEIKKEGLSEYFLYTIEGTETIRNSYSKRLPSFTAEAIPVESLYKYDRRRYGSQTVRFLSFANDTEHELGETPIPGGNIKIYRTANPAGNLAYTGAADIKYIPVGEDVELNLGAARLVKIDQKLMKHKTDNYTFDDKGDVAGWDTVNTYKFEITNTKTIPAKIEITVSFDSPYWKMEFAAPDVEYEKHDAASARFTTTVDPETKKVFEYTATSYYGTRQQSAFK